MSVLVEQINLLKSIDGRNFTGDLKDIQDFYKDWKSLQTEHSQKTRSLCKKYIGRINKENDISKIIKSFLESEIELYEQRDKRLEDLTVFESLKKHGVFLEKLAKKQNLFLGELLYCHDQIISERDRSKMVFDENAQSSNLAKQKYEQSTDPNTMNKLKKMWQNQMANTTVAKNEWYLKSYIVERIQSKWKSQIIPSLFAACRLLEEYKFSALKSCFETFLKEEETHASNQGKGLSLTLSEICNSYNPKKDSEDVVPIYINIGFEGLEDEKFPIETSKPFQNFLLNCLRKSMCSFPNHELKIDYDKKEICGLMKLFNVYKSNETLGDPDLVLDGLLDVTRRLWLHQHEALPDVIIIDKLLPLLLHVSEEKRNLLPDPGSLDSGNHDWFFRGSHVLAQCSFPISKECNVCKSPVWGSGLTCTICKQFICHKKCELKVPFTCHNLASSNIDLQEQEALTNSKGAYLKGWWKRTSTDNIDKSAIMDEQLIHRDDLFQVCTVNSNFLPDISLSFVKDSNDVGNIKIEPNNKDISENDDLDIRSVLYSYEATEYGEIAVSKGEKVIVHETHEDGWCDVTCMSTRKRGLIPESYTATEDKPVNVNVNAVAIYNYAGSDDNELSFNEGDVVEIVKDGENGWSEGYCHGKYGFFPSEYVRKQ